MADNFVGRRRELKVLESAYRGRTSGFIPIYGRRRVGKSELILRFLDGTAIEIPPCAVSQPGGTVRR
jgi:AAA+ ATPase superfamily predicted ATPase